jgi:predicted phosphodiesterase
MTRLIIFSDVHANWEALLALQQAESHPDGLLCLGDTVGYGPEPRRCLDSVRASVTWVIKGRHDTAVSQSGETSLASDDLFSATWPYTRSALPAADRAYLAAQPDELTVEMAGVRFYLARLSPDNAATETNSLITMPQARLQERFGQIEADIILLGGPHLPALRQVDHRFIICPGSLGQPRYGVPDPTYAVWQDGRGQIHHLHYHPDQTITKLALLPLDPEYRLRLQAILRAGRLE